MISQDFIPFSEPDFTCDDVYLLFIWGRKMCSLVLAVIFWGHHFAQWKGKCPPELRAVLGTQQNYLSRADQSVETEQGGSALGTMMSDFVHPVKKAALWRAGQENHPVQYENLITWTNEGTFYSRGSWNKTCSCAVRSSSIQQQWTQDSSGHCSTAALVPSDWRLSHEDLPSK